MVKPLFKWTGGKGRLLQKYTDLGFFPDPSQFDTFVDLFFGAGAVTCWVADMYPDKNLIINDLNTEMMTNQCSRCVITGQSFVITTFVSQKSS